MFPVADGTAKLFARDHEFREPTQRSNLQGVKISEKNFKATRKSVNRQKQEMTLKPKMTSGQPKVTSFVAITLHREFTLRVERRNIPDPTELH